MDMWTDPIRGTKGKQLPWLLDEIQCTDEAGDEWTFKIQCIKMTTAAQAKLIEAHLKLESTCKISTQNQILFGYDPERLAWLHQNQPLTALYSEETIQAKCHIDDLFLQGGKLLKFYKEKILKRSTLEEKKLQIQASLKSIKISNFETI